MSEQNNVNQGNATQVETQVQHEGKMQQPTQPPQPKICGVPWLWPGRISLGAATLIAGDPGLGKSMLTLDIAARLTNGMPFPDQPEDYRREKSGVVVISGEDEVQSTIKPRLMEMGAEVDRIMFLQSVVLRNPRTSEEQVNKFKLDRDVALVRQASLRVPKCRLIVIDPITSFLGDVDANRAQAVRKLIQSLLESLRFDSWPAVLMVSHLNKTRRGNVLSGIAGAMSFAAVARSVWLVTKDPADAMSGRRLMLPVKNNLSADIGGLAFRVAAGNAGAARVEWERGAVGMTADAAMQPESDGALLDRHARVEARVWLKEVLQKGPMAAREVYGRARQDGISKRTLDRAKLDLKVETRRVDTVWTWLMPGFEWVRSEGAVAKVAS